MPEIAVLPRLHRNRSTGLDKQAWKDFIQPFVSMAMRQEYRKYALHYEFYRDLCFLLGCIELADQVNRLTSTLKAKFTAYLLST